ncbi:hypothetical protein CCS92_32515, partial [Methylobacterium radiotolerans]
ARRAGGRDGGAGALADATHPQAAATLATARHQAPTGWPTSPAPTAPPTPRPPPRPRPRPPPPTPPPRPADPRGGNSGPRPQPTPPRPPPPRPH